VRSVRLICDALAEAYLEGKKSHVASTKPQTPVVK